MRDLLRRIGLAGAFAALLAVTLLPVLAIAFSTLGMPVEP